MVKVWVVLYDEPDEPADVLAIFVHRDEAVSYIGEDTETLCVQGPFEVPGIALDSGTIRWTKI